MSSLFLSSSTKALEVDEDVGDTSLKVVYVPKKKFTSKNDKILFVTETVYLLGSCTIPFRSLKDNI